MKYSIYSLTTCAGERWFVSLWNGRVEYRGQRAYLTEKDAEKAPESVQNGTADDENAI